MFIEKDTNRRRRPVMDHSSKVQMRIDNSLDYLVFILKKEHRFKEWLGGKVLEPDGNGCERRRVFPFTCRGICVCLFYLMM